MTNFAFSILYSFCLAFCVGMLEMMRFGLPLPEEPIPPQPVEQVAIAIPPRPEGVREVTGEGDEVYRYTEEACRKLDGQYGDICFQQLAR